MIALYCKFKQEKLLDFLINYSDYDENEAIKVCREYNLFKEEAYLYAKMQREDEAFNVLVKNSANLTDTIEFVLQFKMSKMD